MKFAKFIYLVAAWLDRKNIYKFDYETAPICGHFYNGHIGKYTQSNYREGDGSKVATLPLFRGWKLISECHTYEGWGWCLKKVYSSLSDGRTCTPYFRYIHYHGNVMFRKGFKNKWYANTGAAFHLLGFRFTVSTHLS